MKHDVHLTVRLPKDLQDRIEAVQTEMSKRLSGVEMDRSRVVRLALERGIEVIEKELGLK
jgi:predicted DNA-binding protein